MTLRAFSVMGAGYAKHRFLFHGNIAARKPRADKRMKADARDMPRPLGRDIARQHRDHVNTVCTLSGCSVLHLKSSLFCCLMIVAFEQAVAEHILHCAHANLMGAQASFELKTVLFEHARRRLVG